MHPIPRSCVSFRRSRPTAVNLQDACHALSRTAKASAAEADASPAAVVEKVVAAAEAYFESDVATCKVSLAHTG